MQSSLITRISNAVFGSLPGLLALWLLSSCGLQQDIDVVLPDYPPQLVVEAYLESGQIPRIAVSESAPYLSSPNPQVPTDVKAYLTLPNGQRQELRFDPGIDNVTGKVYTHIGQRRISPTPGQTFRLEVMDTQGRRVTGQATMPALVPIDTVEWKFNDKQGEFRKAYVLTRFRDPAPTTDYYRLQIHRDSISRDPEVEYTVEDRLNNGAEYSLGTSYEFAPNDTIFVTLYHLDQPYFRFLQSVQDARNANGNPFGQPSAIKSTVEGGVGVFTVLSYQRRMVIVK
ncbi:DUF4249 domain-containing protein [Hymenobacter metallilatus]|uniref:DUF4249 domain-containing protein n=1 Tax=Hymenobacter metallilatus TaxID=2493666 RepID=A0A3R9N1J1_9BACT|nr:DUF4249 domain-containing protein [Hymenobacter metallilatus]RSK36323.1 DUF4249 domain-containing protein [Hymenobacter metallilatus]